MRHGVVYQDPKFYAGWPANHGQWQRGDHFLFGFLRGPYSSANRMHHIGQPLEYMLARSVNGGRTWSIEGPHDFEACAVVGPSPNFDLRDTIVRVSGVYDHGGDYTDPRGAFYTSKDFGETWQGPYLFTGLELEEGWINTSRTRYLVQPDGSGLFFLSKGREAVWGTDEVFLVRYKEGRFTFVSTVLSDEARAVMPAVVQDGNYIACAMRRRKSGVREGWIDIVQSQDGGLTWSKPKQVGVAGSHNGNPPALAAVGSRFVCCYGNRDSGALMATTGDLWGVRGVRSFPVVSDGKPDIGYPQLFVREDGVPVVVYYWADKGVGRSADGRQHIRWTSLEE